MNPYTFDFAIFQIGDVTERHSCDQIELSNKEEEHISLVKKEGRWTTLHSQVSDPSLIQQYDRVCNRLSLSSGLNNYILFHSGEELVYSGRWNTRYAKGKELNAREACRLFK